MKKRLVVYLAALLIGSGCGLAGGGGGGGGGAGGAGTGLDPSVPDTFIYHRPPRQTSSSEASFRFHCSSSPCEFECRLNSRKWSSCSSPKKYTGLAEGKNIFRVRATNALGTTDSTPAKYKWVIDTIPPDTIISSKPFDPSNSDNPSFEFTCDQGDCTYECNLDFGAWVSCSPPQTYPGLSDGLHTFQARAIDLTGNVDPIPVSFSWTIDLTPPDTSIFFQPPDPSNSRDAAFDFICDESNCIFQCQLDDSGFVPCAFPAAYSGLSEGHHYFEARAVDQAGNTDPVPAGYNWTVDVTPPDTVITAAPPDRVNYDNASFSFICDESACAFECQLDGGGFSDCASPKNYPGLSDGSHTFQVRAVDAASNLDGSPAGDTWKIDTVPPETNIASHPANPVNLNYGAFSFTCDEAGCSFECDLDGAGFSACVSPKTYPGLADGNHTFQVRATDALGNPDPTPASYPWLIDTTAPDTNIDSNPPNPSASGSASFSFSHTEPGSTFECQLDSGGWVSCSAPKDYSGLTDGDHTFQVRAIDPADNPDSSPAGYSWKIDTAPPDTSIIAHPPDPSHLPNPVFEFNCNEAICAFECKMDSGAWAACSSPKDYSGLADGGHTFQVRAIDQVNLPDPAPASYIWTIDLTAPDTYIDSNPANPSGFGSASFSFSYTDPGSTFECQLDSGGWVSCSAPKDYSGLADGDHIFEVRATDALGNLDLTPAQYNWTIDTAPPDTGIIAHPADPSHLPNPAFEFNCNEAICVFECKMDSGAWVSCSSPKDYSALADGGHTFQVRAIDQVNLPDPAPASYSWTIDLTAPDTFIDSNPANPADSGSASFSFFGDEPGCVLQCQLDGSGWAACSSPKDYAGLADGYHTFQVRAIDPAGNPDPSPANYSWKIDTTPPDTNLISYPADPANLSSATFSFGCNETVCSFECQLDTGGFNDCSSPQNYTLLPDGDHAFEVRATDAVGLTDSTPATYLWLIDTTPPNTVITLSPSNPSNSPDPTFGFAADEGNCSFECKMDAGAWTACSSPKSYFGLSQAGHTFQVRATDVVGLTDSTPATFIWTIDTTPPDTSINSTPPDPDNSSSAAFSFAATEPGSTFECKLDGGGFAACASPKIYTGIAPADHTFQVRSIDPAGNVDLTPAVYSWTIEANSYNCFQIIIDPAYQVTVIPPSSFSPVADYPGLNADRVSDQIQVNSWLSSNDPAQLVIKITNIGSQDLPRLWMDGLLQIGGEVLDPDALNQGEHPVLVFGPLAPGETMSRTFNLNLTDLPCTLLWDPLKIQGRVAYASDFKMPLSWRAWSANLSGKNPTMVTSLPDLSVRIGRLIWTAGMEWIGFSYFGGNGDQIGIVHPDGSHFRIVASGSTQINFFPDGKEIFYLCSYRVPTSSYDLCLNDLSGASEQVLIRGDGYYWDGTGYQAYTPLPGNSAFLQTSLYRPTLSPDGRKIIFIGQDPNLSLAPLNLNHRWLMLDAQFDPSSMTLQGAPALAGKLFDGDTLSNSNKFLGLYEFVPTFSPDGKNLVGFVKEFKYNAVSKKFALDFYGLVRIKIDDLMAQPSPVYIGNTNYMTKILDIRIFSNSVDASYINFQDYSDQVGGILFTVKFDDQYATVYLLPVNANFVPQGAPKAFIQNAYFNAFPDVATPVLPGAYQ